MQKLNVQESCTSLDKEKAFRTQLFIGIVEHEHMVCYLW